MSVVACFGLLFVMWCEQPAPPPAIVTCPAIPAWSQQYQQDLADEIAILPADSPLVLAAREHLRLRAQIRKCANKKKELR